MLRLAFLELSDSYISVDRSIFPVKRAISFPI